MSEHVEIIKEIMVLPTGMDIDDVNARHFAVIVQWRGNKTSDGAGGYAVNHISESLSRAGKWNWPERFQYRQYRWDTLEEALEAARAAVNDVKLHGLTFAQWVEKREQE